MNQFTGSDNRAQIVKGKRTKRRQKLSPAHIEAAMATVTLSGGGVNDHSSILSSPSSSVDMEESSTREHREEDMADCLVLLAQGNDPRQVEDEKGGQEVYNCDNKGKSGKGCFQPYKCKTCGRTFASFQALGGHRSSHMKKPKSMGQQKPLKSSPKRDCDDSLGHVLGHGSTKMYVGLDEVNTKMRECSICGLRFKSGQALGGHMRRHRALNAGARHVSVTSLKVTLRSDQKRLGNILPLDLNLPAPEDDVDHYGSQIHHFSPAESQKASPMVPTAATLVECLF
ncbi:hypothetical protein BT93_C0025 [Corymbia citriodora subsp. variegata]|nr:hypothetical protein BT93_C0025 [Corymbia citriodora subsp. variegata]